MFSSQVTDGARYITGLSKSMATSVWSYFRGNQEESDESGSESSDFDFPDYFDVPEVAETPCDRGHNDLDFCYGDKACPSDSDDSETSLMRFEDVLDHFKEEESISCQFDGCFDQIYSQLEKECQDEQCHENIVTDHLHSEFPHSKNEMTEEFMDTSDCNSSQGDTVYCDYKQHLTDYLGKSLDNEKIDTSCLKDQGKTTPKDLDVTLGQSGTCVNSCHLGCQDETTQNRIESNDMNRDIGSLTFNGKDSDKINLNSNENIQSPEDCCMLENDEQISHHESLSCESDQIKCSENSEVAIATCTCITDVMTAEEASTCKSNFRDAKKETQSLPLDDVNVDHKILTTSGFTNLTTQANDILERTNSECDSVHVLEPVNNQISTISPSSVDITRGIQCTPTTHNHFQLFNNLQLVTLRPIKGMRSSSSSSSSPNSPYDKGISQSSPNSSPFSNSGINWPKSTEAKKLVARSMVFTNNSRQSENLSVSTAEENDDSVNEQKKEKTDNELGDMRWCSGTEMNSDQQQPVTKSETDDKTNPDSSQQTKLSRVPSKGSQPRPFSSSRLRRSIHQHLDNTHFLFNKLVDLYGECTDLAVREAVVVLNTSYNGYMLHFCDAFMDPAIVFLNSLKKSHYDANLHGSELWPLCFHGSIIIHIQEVKRLFPGQQYLFIKRTTHGEIYLAVKHFTSHGMQNVTLRNSTEISDTLKMEWSNRLQTRTEDDLGKLLQRTMTNFEESIQRIKLEESSDSCKDCNRNRQIADRKKVPQSFANRSKFKLNKTDGYHSQMNSESSCSPSRNPGFYNHRTLDVPKTIMDVDYNLLQSGIAILPGCRDIRGGAVIFIFTQSSLWQNQQVSSSELSRLLMYYRSVPRDEVRQKGLTIVVDVRGSNSSTINVLLEAIYLLEGNVPHCIHSLLFVADVQTESLVLKSPVYDHNVSFKSSVLLSVDQLCDSIELDQLPLIFHGLFVYCHEDWIRFHMKLDPFLSKLKATAKYLICVIQDLSDIDEMPKTVSETSQLITHHKESVKSALCDQRLISLQSEGKAIISDLRKEEEYMSHTEDFRDSMKMVDLLYSQLQGSMVKLVKLSDTRQRKLEKCLHLREFEEESSKVISWLQSHGGQIAERYSNLADNLKAIRSQQKDFEKFHFSAMSYIEKGNDLLEESSILAQSGDFDDVTGYKELARTLKKHLVDFTQKLEATRERIESTTKCYHLLDKSYEWALEAMKYVASMKMDHSTTLEGLEKLLRSLELYLRQHPAMTEATFASMSELAAKLKNDKLLEQCRVAKARCVETNNLLNLRLGTLRRAKEKMVREQNSSQNIGVGSPHRTPERTCVKEPSQMSASYDSGTGSWQPSMASTPVPNHAIHPAFRKCISETSFSSPSPGGPFITEDLSNRVVTSIPKVLNDTTLKSSREDLTEDSQDGAHSKQTDSRSPSKQLDDTVFKTPQEPGNTLSSRNRPVKKMLKRTTTPSLDSSEVIENGHNMVLKRSSAPLPCSVQVIPEEDESKLSPQTRNPKALGHDLRPVSMITASSDSLSSLQEEEEDQENNCTSNQSRHWSPVVCGSPPTREWTPVPVNTHLSEFNRNVPTGPLASLKLTGKGSNSKSVLAHVMCEMVQTERDYVNSLQYIIENYIPELQREDVPQALRGKRNVIFGNIEKIYQFHYQYFLNEVQMCEQKPFQIAHYFLMHENFFYLYALYNKNKPKSDALMAEYGKHFFKRKQEQLGDRMDLASYLLKPVQRMGKYALMLKQIMKECAQSDQEYQHLRAAEHMVKFQLRHGNDLLAMDALRECDVNLQEQGSLLRQEEFLVWQGRKKSLRHVFLFEDMILFSKTKRTRQGGPEYYIYKNSFKMADMGLTENYGESGYKFEIWFRRRNSGDNYVLQAPNSEVKHNWTRDISKILWNQATKNRERHMTEMATMGIGNKPCLDIKPSANNIQDRFINYALGGRGARTRNSVAVSSFDHSRLNNKRPHSIISIGSTSSSNSSHSGLFINPGVSGDPFDSPRHTAHTCLSNESGIGTDVSSNCVDQSDNFTKEMSPSHHYHMPRDSPLRQFHHSDSPSRQYQQSESPSHQFHPPQNGQPMGLSSTDV